MNTLTIEKEINDIQHEPDYGIAIHFERREDLSLYMLELQEAQGLAKAILHSYESKLPLQFGKIPQDGRLRVKQILKRLQELEAKSKECLPIYYMNLKEMHKLKEELNYASLKVTK